MATLSTTAVPTHSNIEHNNSLFSHSNTKCTCCIPTARWTWQPLQQLDTATSEANLRQNKAHKTTLVWLSVLTTKLKTLNGGSRAWAYTTMADELQQVGGWKAGVGEAAVCHIQFPIPKPFDGKPKSWPKWHKCFEQYRNSTSLDETEQVSTFLYYMGNVADDILATLNVDVYHRIHWPSCHIWHTFCCVQKCDFCSGKV